MDFYKNGSKVEILESNVIATVIGVCIRGIEPNIAIEYHVQWMAGATIYDHWVYSYQVKEYVNTKQKAGMVNYETLPEK